MGASKARAETARAELERLAKYKALHDCLHLIQFQLPAILRASDGFQRDPTVGQALEMYLRTLARLEGQEVFRALAERFPALHLESDRLEYQPSIQFRSLKALPVGWS